MKKIILVIFYVIVFVFFINHKIKGQGLTSLSGGVTTHGYINAFTFDSVNKIFYAGGAFNYMDGVKAMNIAKWDGNQWGPILDTIDGFIYSLLVIDGKLYATGNFTRINNKEIKSVALWNGEKWSGVGEELPNYVISLIYFKHQLYAIMPNESSGINTFVLVKLENNKWNKILEFKTDLGVKTAINNDRICFYGYFNKVNDTLANNIIEYDGNKIEFLPLPFDVTNTGILDVVYYKDTLYLKSINTIQRLVNYSWEIISNLYGRNIFEYQNDLCVVEESINPSNNDQKIFKLAKLKNGLIGDTLGYLIYDIYKDQKISSIDIYNNKLYLYGFFDNINGDNSSLCLMEYDSSVWKNIGKPAFMSYVNPFVATRTYDLFTDTVSNSLYVGGKFDFAGGNYSQNISIWNGTKWSNSGQGFNAEVLKILRFKNELYAFGIFTKSGTNSINGIARWNGLEWTNIGSGANRGVLDAIIFNGELYICGYFDTVNGVNARYVAKYDGVSWSSVGNNNLDNASKKLIVFNGELYIAARNAFYLGSNFSYSYMAVLKSTGWAFFNPPNLTKQLGSAQVYKDELYLIDQKLNFCKLNKQGNWELLAKGDDFFYFSPVKTYYPNILIVNDKIWISVQNNETYLYDKNTLSILHKNLNPSHKNLNPNSVCVFQGETIIGGFMIGYQDNVNSKVKYLNNIAELEFSNSGFDIQLNSSDICKGDSVSFNLVSNDPFAKTKWFFQGGIPDTSSVFNPLIGYLNQGVFKVFVEINNTMGVDTIFLNKTINVKSCVNDSFNEIAVYPNPTSNFITIKSDFIPQNIKLCDLVGKTILEVFGSNTIDLSGLAKSMYLLSFKIENILYQIKVIKN